MFLLEKDFNGKTDGGDEREDEMKEAERLVLCSEGEKCGASQKAESLQQFLKRSQLVLNIGQTLYYKQRRAQDAIKHLEKLFSDKSNEGFRLHPQHTLLFQVKIDDYVNLMLLGCM